MLGFKDLFGKVSALRLADAELEDALVDRLKHTRDREYSAAMEAMLTARVARLRRDVLELSQKKEGET